MRCSHLNRALAYNKGSNMNLVNRKRIDVLSCIFSDEVKNATEWFNLSGDTLQVTIDQQSDSLKTTVLSFETSANNSEFDCELYKDLPPNSCKKCRGRFSDDSLFIHNVRITNWDDLERVWAVS